MTFRTFVADSPTRQQWLIAALGASVCALSCSPGNSARTNANGNNTTGGSGSFNPGGTGGGSAFNPQSDASIPGNVNTALCAKFGNLACHVVDCGGTLKTTVTAKVYDPAGKNPLYDVVVYVPNAAVADISNGVTCETCATPVTGDPIASALTNAQGQFTMENVPVGTSVPMVIQIGKWRRQITLPEVKACQDNTFDDPTLFRLPKNQSEGHLPKIAISTGEADSLECLLRRIGVDDSEFTNPNGTGRINLFLTPCVAGACDPSDSMYSANGQAFPSAWTSLWGSVDQLKVYDIVLMSCTGSQSAGRDVTTVQKQALKDYLYAGGRAFLEHYNYSWLRGGLEDQAIEDTRKYTTTPFPPMATWATAANPSIDTGSPSYVPYSIDTSFPKGNDFADWLVNVGASTTKGTINLMDVKHPALSVITPPSQRWVYNATAVPYFMANTPFESAPDQQCGRVVHTGIHVAIVASDSTSSPFPTGCKPENPLSAQEKAMEFLLFDLSSCVLPPDVQQQPPPPIN
jgi:hypothetical protein